ncbi:hypothetical protein B0H66DRAFT_467132 [Apodospora peruviana]|uniref:DUF8004 domain-containing protein n=1 Tax=Apodospora peruviana TaxID=516989 RepID=A0AAE0MER4_9PEZI|nr:hypothetical protein B0H66DRAFT_467132 [Apodospora peruviana]
MLKKKVPKDPSVLQSHPPSVAATQPGRKPRDRVRSSSPARPAQNAKLQSNRLHPGDVSSASTPRGRSSSVQPPQGRPVSAEAPRILSNPTDSRPQSQSSDGSHEPNKVKSRRSWLPGGRSRSSSQDSGKAVGAVAWIMAPDGRSDYSTAALEHGEKARLPVPELWNETGNVYVYIYPQESGHGPSFKVSDHVFGSSQVLYQLLMSGKTSPSTRSASSGSYLTADDATRRQYTSTAPALGSDPNAGHLHLPLGNPEIDLLVAARNLFAFLTGQPLVATKRNPTIFATVLQLAGMLKQFGFTNVDGSTYGDIVDASFDLFIDQFNLADVRHSREKTIEALVLAEQMRSWALYNEAFAHAVGKYDELLDLKSPLFNEVSSSTRNRLERAHLDLGNRQANLNHRLETFDFPSLFAGVASSTSTEEYKAVKFKEWRNSYLKMRSFVMGYYKDSFGNWPPKARSKKNHFAHSGLNRQCLKILYSDLCALYNLLVDRESITPRVIDQVFEDVQENPVDQMISALRKMLSEFDHSSPPVLPPIPFDVPKLPSITTIRENYYDLDAKTQAKFDKSLQANELLLVLIKSRNIDTDALKLPFLVAYKEFELKEAKNVQAQDLADQRIGHWLFLYAVIQSLPMLVVDAPDLRHTEGVEYFLCEPPQGHLPWMVEDAGEVRKMWYQTAGQGIVELSADVILNSVEGIYMRSHCWLAAKEWEQRGSQPASLINEVGVGGGLGGLGGVASPLEPPRAVFEDMDPMMAGGHGGRRGSAGGTASPGSAPGSPGHPRNSSPARRAGHAYRSSIAIGLEPLPLTDDVLGSAGSGGSPRGSRAFSGGPPRPGSSGSGNVTPQQQQYQHHPLALRNSRSSGNLGSMSAGGPLAGAVGNPHHHASSGSMSATTGGGGGGSTFDDILKGIEKDKGEKKKKSFFGS